MAILAHFADQNARAAALGGGEPVSQFERLLELGIVLTLGRIDARDGAIHGLVPPEYLFESIRDFTERGSDARRLDGEVEQVACTRFGAAAQRVEGLLDVGLVAFALGFTEAAELALAHGAVVDFANRERSVVVYRYLLTPTMNFLAGVDAGLARAAASSMRIFGRPVSMALVMPRGVRLLRSNSTPCASARR